jgi:dihydroflavonol-4-reductase
MTTLVTGASGHVGANLVRTLLAQGRPVRALIHLDRRAVEGLDIMTVQGDICEPRSLDRAFEGVETVFHLAANLSLTSTRDLETVNVSGTKNVVDACLRHRVKQMVHFSSIDAIAYNPEITMVDESSPLLQSSSYSTYGQSKAAAEREVRRGLERGLNIITIRPTAILGPFDYQPSFFGQVLLLLARGRMPGLITGGFDWVDVRDVIQGALQAEKTAPTGAEYLLSGHWASLCDVAAIVNDVAGRGVPKFVCPLWLAGIGAPFATAYARMRNKRPLFTQFSIKTVRNSKRVSHEKATRELGYQPRPLESSIEDTLNWFCEAGKLDLAISNHRLEKPQ